MIDYSSVTLLDFLIYDISFEKKDSESIEESNFLNVRQAIQIKYFYAKKIKVLGIISIM